MEDSGEDIPFEDYDNDHHFHHWHFYDDGSHGDGWDSDEAEWYSEEDEWDSMGGSDNGIRAELAVQLAVCPLFGTLEVRHTRFGKPEMEAVLRTLQAQCSVALSLSEIAFTHHAADFFPRLFAAPHATPHLRMLALANVRGSMGLAKALERASSLDILSLYDCDGSDWKEVFSALRNCTSLGRLEISEMRIQCGTLAALCSSLPRLSALRTLMVRHVQMEDGDVGDLVDAVAKLPHLRCLKLDRNRLSDDNVVEQQRSLLRHLQRALPCCTELREFHLFPALQEEVVDELVVMLAAAQHLVELELHVGACSARSFRALTRTLNECSSLRRLNLVMSPVKGFPTCETLCNMIRNNCSLTCLSLQFDFGHATDSRTEVLDALKHSRITRFRTSMRIEGSAAVEAVVDLLRHAPLREFVVGDLDNAGPVLNAIAQSTTMETFKILYSFRPTETEGWDASLFANCRNLCLQELDIPKWTLPPVIQGVIQRNRMIQEEVKSSVHTLAAIGLKKRSAVADGCWPREVFYLMAEALWETKGDEVWLRDGEETKQQRQEALTQTAESLKEVEQQLQVLLKKKQRMERRIRLYQEGLETPRAGDVMPEPTVLPVASSKKRPRETDVGEE